MDRNTFLALLRSLPVPVIGIEELFDRRPILHKKASLTNAAAQTLDQTTISEEGYYEISGGIVAEDAQTARVRFSLILEDENLGTRYVEQVGVIAAGQREQFRPIRRYLRKNWVLSIAQEDTIALNQEISYHFNIDQLLI